MTTVRDLREMLQDYDDDTEVLIVHQESWPLALVVDRMVSDDEIAADSDVYDERVLDEREADEDADGPGVVWIVAGGHPWDRSPYGPKAAFQR